MVLTYPGGASTAGARTGTVIGRTGWSALVAMAALAEPSLGSVREGGHGGKPDPRRSQIHVASSSNAAATRS
jgi:hypothetical protein